MDLASEVSFMVIIKVSSMQVDMVLGKELKVLHLDQQATGDLKACSHSDTLTTTRPHQFQQLSMGQASNT